MTATAKLRLFSCGYELDSSDECLGTPTDCTRWLDDPEALRHHMREEGYLYLPGYLDVNQVLDARREITDHLAAMGVLDPRFPSMDAVAHPQYSDVRQHELARKIVALEKVLYNGRMMRFFERFLGGPVRHYDYTWLRVVAPGKGTPSHCDIVYMGRGTQELYTAWTPLGDIDRALGGLMFLERSHKHGRLRETYCKKDVDTYCVNRPSGEKDRVAFGTNGALGGSPPRVRSSLGGRWLTDDYHAGDIVLFSAFLVHGGLDNQTGRVRLSSDSRYQLATEPVDERWVGENPVAHGPGGKKSKIC